MVPKELVGVHQASKWGSAFYAEQVEFLRVRRHEIVEHIY